MVTKKKQTVSQKAKGKRNGVHTRVITEAHAFKKEFASKLLDLMTSGFGLVAALAWNELIKEVIDQNIQPLFGQGSGVISKLIYAVMVTLLAVLVTYNLSKLAQKEK